jgi:hypothetical protein
VSARRRRALTAPRLDIEAGFARVLAGHDVISPVERLLIPLHTIL